jgi:glycine/D-amino acid oxidase-like deaminating enzyme
MSINRRSLLIGGASVVALAGLSTLGYMGARPSRKQAPGVSRAEKVNSSSQIPAEVDVAIIGGGIVGVMAAMYLKQKGQSVVVLEKGVVAGEQSSRAFGWISSLGDEPRRLGLAAPSGAIWRSMNEKLGIDTTYRQNGLMYECADDASVDFWQQWAKDNPEQGGKSVQILRGDALAARLPGGVADKWHAAVLQPLDGSVEPPAGLPRIANALIAQGLNVVENCAVRGIETSAGAVSAVVTEKGTIKCKSVVVAGGAWARLFMQNLGIDMPLLRVYSYMMRLPNFENAPVGSGWGSGTPWRKEVGDTYSVGLPANVAPMLLDNLKLAPTFYSSLVKNWDHFELDPTREFYESLFAQTSWQNNEVSPFERERILAPDPKFVDTKDALAKFQAAFPQANVQPIDQWGGVIDITPDNAPIIEKVEKIPGLVFAAGMSGHGLSMAPAAGELIAQLVLNETQTIVDPKNYTSSRF